MLEKSNIVSQKSPGLTIVPSLRLLAPDPGAAKHNGEVFGCAYSPDGNHLLTGGWDAHLRLWDAQSGAQVTAFQAGSKPISACAFSPDGRRLLSGSLDGFLVRWDASSQEPVSRFVAHARPISAIVFSGDGQRLATSSWDRNLILWDQRKDNDGRILAGHDDIVSGCRFTPDARMLVSWSYDGTLGLWDVARGQPLALLPGHPDRLTAGAVSPDGQWAASGSRDQALKLWNLSTQEETASASLEAEVRACLFLLDAEYLIAVDAQGQITLHALPDLGLCDTLQTGLRVQCAELSPSGAQVVLGCETGEVRLMAVEGFDGAPLAVTATRTSRRTATALQRFFGRSRLTEAYLCTCPVCRETFELPNNPSQPQACPSCRRSLRIRAVAACAQES
jgi:WD40 repeat protein